MGKKETSGAGRFLDSPEIENISLTLRAAPKVSEKTNELCISSTMPYILISFSKTKPIFAT